MRTCKEHTRKVSHQDPESKKQAEYYSQEADAVQGPTASLKDLDVPQEESPDEHFDQSEHQSLEKEPTPETGPARESTLHTPGPIEEPKTIADDFPENFGSMQDLQIHGHQLKKYPTSDSLDEYMDKCCRLSEVNQGNSKALGSGLGYLEHICQLIEKIGQLQEHNMRLQKQVCSLQKQQKISQIKEEYVLQHCSCGAASVLNSHQDVKTSFAGRNRPHSLLVQTGNPSDLSIIPEIGVNTEKLSSCNGSERYPESGNSQLMVGLRKLSNNRNNKENEYREAGSMTEVQAFLSKDPAVRKVSVVASFCSQGESHAWGRMKDLMRKTRLRNQNKLGLSSAALKRSCPQLYR
ncbi:hypothetical protein N333_03568 [Nestor notabilis]|uniref:DUF4657 domain-containing protein n=1 Tax=Nestor notabilis TaxID=176057 RepID=A0A091S0C6_NESNO|nr:hypothetical protein N333_03568 [Nestor notabilis]